MRLSKFLLLTSFVTLFSTIYVWQQTEIFRLAYLGQKHLILFQDLLDKNAVLRYNIGKDSSLIRIGEKVYKSADFQMPESYRLVKSTHPNNVLSAKRQVPERNLLSSLFSIKRQAEAKTIGPSVPFAVEDRQGKAINR